MHIAFVSLGAFGHINPTLALVTELVKKGVRVTYFTTEAFRTIIEPTGAKFVAVPSWMAENDKHNEDGEKKEDDGGVAAAVPFLFLNEAGAYIDTVLDTLKNDKPDAVVHDFAGIAGTIAADNLKVANVMLYTSYPSNDSYSVAAGFENCPPDHPLRKAAAQLAQTYAEKYGCRLRYSRHASGSAFFFGLDGDGAWTKSIGMPRARPGQPSSGNAADTWRKRCAQTKLSQN